ncbi:MAG: hypothetical protein Q8P06_02440 [Candidatus Azambacteria bacterium]|nr:hypothetical protein [Candidatus Azambacteria bacterium]
MNNDFSELIQYLDDKFTKVDDHFSEIDEKFSVVNERFSSVDSQLGYIKENKVDKSDFNNLLTAVDKYAQKADTYFQEMVMLSHKVDRHEKWLLELAEKLGIKLKY